MEKRKVSIIGSGYVGSTIAFSLAISNFIDQICLIDINENKVNAECLDINHGFSSEFKGKILFGKYSDISDSDIVIITAGRARKPGETRNDLFFDNSLIINNIITEIKKFYNDAYIIVVTNPVDALTQVVKNSLSKAADKIYGTGCLLDTSRFIQIISKLLDVDTSCIDGMVIGEHGDNLLPLWERIYINSEPITNTQNLKKYNLIMNNKDKIFNCLKNYGANIIEGKGKTHFGISICVVYLINCFYGNKTKHISLSTNLQVKSQYPNSISLSYPCIIGNKSIQIDTEYLSNEEEKKLNIICERILSNK